MKPKMFAVFSAVTAFAIAPAFADTSATSAPPSSSNIGQTLQQDLQKAGFTDVKVLPEVYMVHAKDSHGNPVMMRIGPDSMTELSELPAAKSGSAAADAGTTNPPPANASK